MKSRLLSALVAGSMIMSSSSAIAQAVPVTEAVQGDSALFGDRDNGTIIGIAFFLSVFVIFIFNEEIFGDDDEDDDEQIPVSP